MKPVPYYASPEARGRLAAESQRWLGTPFRAGSAVPGPLGGVDCVRLCAAIHAACGACDPLDIPAAPMQWHMHHEQSLLLDWFRGPDVRGRVKRIEEGEPWLSGDLVAVQTGLAAHHLGTWLDDAQGRHLLHVPVGSSVQRWSLDDRLLKGRIAAVWRIHA